MAAEQARLLSGGSINIAAVTADLKSSTIAATDAALLTGAELNLRGGVVQGARVGLDLEHVSLREKARAEAVADLAFRAALAELSDAGLSSGSDLFLDVGKSRIRRAEQSFLRQ